MQRILLLGSMAVEGGRAGWGWGGRDTEAWLLRGVQHETMMISIRLCLVCYAEDPAAGL